MVTRLRARRAATLNVIERRPVTEACKWAETQGFQSITAGIGRPRAQFRLANHLHANCRVYPMSPFHIKNGKANPLSGRSTNVRDSSQRCPYCQSYMVRSRPRSAPEDLAFTLGSDILRCGSCGHRFLVFLRFSIPRPSHSGCYSAGGGFMIVWFAIIAGFLSCLGIAI